MSVNEKHVEFLQNNIARMNQCSFQMKGWAITVISALVAVYVTTISDMVRLVFNGTEYPCIVNTSRGAFV